MDVKLPDGTLLQGVPDGTTQEQLLNKLLQANHPAAQSLLSQVSQQNALNETSGLGKFNAGVGLAFENIGRAGKQLVGLPSEYQQNSGPDRALMGTKEGLAGNVSGNIAAFAPLSVIPGANTIAGAGGIGGVMGAMQPTDTAKDRLKNMGIGTALGAGMQALTQYPNQIYEGAKSLIKKPFQTAQAAVEPLYEGGRQKILARALADATGANRAQTITNLKNAQELVPGSLPTAAEAGESGGLAAMQRSASAVDPESYATRAAQQNEARSGLLQDLAGTSGQREFYDASRQTAAKQLYDEAYKKGIDKTQLTTGTRGEITKLLKRPAIQEALSDARTLAANEGVKLNDPAGSVKGLDYVKRALDDKISSATGNEQRVLVDLKNRLLTTIDKLSPDYAQARTTFTAMSKPINQMDIAQAIADKSINKLTGQVQPQAFARALSDDTAASATGFGKATLEKTLEPDQLSKLNAIKSDLARSVMARDLGRGVGSDTTQKLAMTNLMQRSGLPVGVLHLPGVGRVGNWIYQNADQEMRQELAKTLLDPKRTAQMMEAYKPYIPLGAPSQLTKDRAAMLARMLALPAATADQK